jgi:hypothetical protein
MCLNAVLGRIWWSGSEIPTLPYPLQYIQASYLRVLAALPPVLTDCGIGYTSLPSAVYISELSSGSGRFTPRTH